MWIYRLSVLRYIIERHLPKLFLHKVNISARLGGHGQYGDTWIRFEPLPKETGFEFEDTIKGRIIPARFIPAIEKGLREAIKKRRTRWVSNYRLKSYTL